MDTIKDKRNNVKIEAGHIDIGKNVIFGKNIDIKVKGSFKVGDFSNLGSNLKITGEDVIFGNHFFHTNGLNIGGGGSQFSSAKLKVGDRCVFHNNYINLAKEINIGDDVGLSPDVQIITHGFWSSVLEGFPRKFEPVNIWHNVIVGQRSMILPGVNIASDTVIGAQSVVSKSIVYSGIYAGNPCKFIRKIIKPDQATKTILFDQILNDLLDSFARRYTIPIYLTYRYPIIECKDCMFDLEKQTITGKENNTTDYIRDFLRRYGIRIYTERPFKDTLNV